MAADPMRAVLADEEVLATTFYREGEDAPKLAALDGAGKRRKAAKRKPDHYEIICISIYKDDLARLDDKVEALKAKGHRRMTRSALIRYALDRLAVDDVPRPTF